MSATRPSRRTLVESSTLGVGALLALVLLGIVNYFGWKYYHRFDWTESRLYTLSEKSRNVLAALDRPIEAVVFLPPTDPLFDPSRELLSRYAAESPRFTVRVVDAEKNPAEARSLVERYELTQLNGVVFDAGDDRRLVESNDLADYDYSGMQFGQGPRMTGFKGEQAFTGAVLELAESRKPKILFTSGHGELKIDDYSASGLSQAQDLLGRDNFEVEEWATLGQPAVPEGTDLVVVAGPTSGFAEPEVEVLRAYLNAGGRMLMLLDPTLSGDRIQPVGLEELLAEFGVDVGANIVVDPANPLPFYGAETIFVGDFGSHAITRSLSQAQVPVILPLARSIAQREDVEGWELHELLRTSAEGWGEVDLAALGRVEKGEGDLAGPVSLGLAVEAAGADDGTGAAEVETEEELDPVAAELAEGGEAPPTTTRLVVLGDSDFATNSQLANVGNAELLANSMNWLVERETLVGIAPKAPEQVRLSLSSSQLSRLSWLVLGILPGLAIASGVTMHFRRRR